MLMMLPETVKNSLKMTEIIEFRHTGKNSRGTFEYRQERARAHKLYNDNMLNLKKAFERFKQARQNAIDSLDNRLSQPDEETLEAALPTIEAIDGYVRQKIKENPESLGKFDLTRDPLYEGYD